MMEKYLPRYHSMQNEFYLDTRNKYEGVAQDLVAKEGFEAITYFGLALGFLTGKYRTLS